MKILTKKFICAIVIAVLSLAMCFTPLFATQYAYAAETVSSIDDTDVLADLEGSTLNGKEFNKDDFAQSDIREPQIISFVEYGYSFYTNRQDDYGLYVYIYNPYAVVFDNDWQRNQIQFRAGELASAKYHLVFLDYSDELGYEGIFYKYKVMFSSSERERLLYSLSRVSRVYEVTEFELSLKGVVKSYSCGIEYTYTGFAEGYGSEATVGDGTLTCSVDGFEEYVGLDVHQTVYRPRGDFLDKDAEGGQLYNGNQSQLNSCYFRVPKKYFTQYGELTKTVCTWYEYMTQPMLVTTNINDYRLLSALHGRPIEELFPADDTGVMIASYGNEYYVDPQMYRKTPFLWASNLDEFEESYSKYFVEHAYRLYWPGHDGQGWLEKRFTNFAGVFYAGSGSTYYTATVPADRVKDELLNNSEYLGGPYYCGLYSQALFTDYIDDAEHKFGYNKVEIDLKKNSELMWSEPIRKGLGYFGVGELGATDPFTFSVQQGITLKESDLKGDDAEVAETLYVAVGDVPDLRAEFEKAVANDEELVLLRYANTNYHSGKVVIETKDVSAEEAESKDNSLMSAWLSAYHAGSVNGYLCQETVFLDFDVISLWFETIDAKTEIPVMMTPQAVISGLQPGVSHHPTANKQSGTFKWVLALFVVVLLVVVGFLVYAVFRKGRSGRMKSETSVNLNLHGDLPVSKKGKR